MSNALEQMYQELILDHSKSPEGKGDPSVHPFVTATASPW